MVLFIPFPCLLNCALNASSLITLCAIILFEKIFFARRIPYFHFLFCCVLCECVVMASNTPPCSLSRDQRIDAQMANQATMIQNSNDKLIHLTDTLDKQAQAQAQVQAVPIPLPAAVAPPLPPAGYLLPNLNLPTPPSFSSLIP